MPSGDSTPRKKGPKAVAKQKERQRISGFKWIQELSYRLDFEDSITGVSDHLQNIVTKLKDENFDCLEDMVNDAASLILCDETLMAFQMYDSIITDHRITEEERYRIQQSQAENSAQPRSRQESLFTKSHLYPDTVAREGVSVYGRQLLDLLWSLAEALKAFMKVWLDQYDPKFPEDKRARPDIVQARHSLAFKLESLQKSRAQAEHSNSEHDEPMSSDIRSTGSSPTTFLGWKTVKDPLKYQYSAANRDNSQDRDLTSHRPKRIKHQHLGRPNLLADERKEILWQTGELHGEGVVADPTDSTSPAMVKETSSRTQFVKDAVPSQSLHVDHSAGIGGMDIFYVVREKIRRGTFLPSSK